MGRDRKYKEGYTQGLITLRTPESEDKRRWNAHCGGCDRNFLIHTASLSSGTREDCGKCWKADKVLHQFNGATEYILKGEGLNKLIEFCPKAKRQKLVELIRFLTTKEDYYG